MPTEVQSQPSSPDPLQPPRVGVDKYPSSGQHDPMLHPSCDPRTKFNLQHREALRTALGSILAPKRPSMSGSRSSSGTATPAQSYSGSSGTYTPTTPSPGIYTPSLDASNSQEHALARIHLPHAHPHFHPTHPPSKLSRAESTSDPEAPPSMPMAKNPPQHAIPPHKLFRSRSHNPSNPPSSRTRTQPLTPPLAPTHPVVTMPDTADLGPALSPPLPVVATSSGSGDKINTARNQIPSPSMPPLPPPAMAVTQTVATVTNGTGPSTDHQHPGGGTSPRAKFLQTLQGKSAWDALIHGSFS